MSYGKLFEEKVDPSKQKTGRHGPPNRMNDLSYTDWMKFQKSFFRYSCSQALAEECIHFFTKAKWANGRASRSLVLGLGGFDTSTISQSRIVDSYPHLGSLRDTLDKLNDVVDSGEEYDFVLADLRYQIEDVAGLVSFIRSYSDEMFQAIRHVLAPKAYCGIVVGTVGRGGAGFPLPWTVANVCRSHLRLRDEKIALMESEGRVIYVLFMQNDEDERPAMPVTPENVCVAETGVTIPAWLLPKPPPRKKHEVLHPAKFPETLVSQFIELFTKPNDTVFDPMVGTGSTVVAAICTGRNGYGMDIVPEFVEIAKRRIAEVSAPTLFPDLSPVCKAEVFQGDVADLERIPGLSGMTFDYVVTSPPYWSMLYNFGSEGQRARRQKRLPLVYSQDSRDLGNIADYDSFLNALTKVYNNVAQRLVEGGYLTIVAKNVKRNHILYTLAWDLVARLCHSRGTYEYVGTTLWCQDDIGLKPFAVGIHWVSNTMHQYCLHFRKRSTAFHPVSDA